MAVKSCKYAIPDWAKSAVWYQIFPERFYNGDKGNDPTAESISGAWPYSDAHWHLHPWTSDWYELQPYEKKCGLPLWEQLYRRRYGGDLRGILIKLDYLQNLGVNALYLTPIFYSPSSHKYDALTYHHVDPYLGPDPEGDKKLIAKEKFDNPKTWMWTAADRLFLKLVDEVHQRGMRIILDCVFNHMGHKSIPFQDVVKHQKKSKYKDWFQISSWNDAKRGSKLFYHGWHNVHELPQTRRKSNGTMDEGLWKYFQAATKRWMAPDGDVQKGINGWRLDTVHYVPLAFWKQFYAHVKSINPDSYVVGELIYETNAPEPPKYDYDSFFKIHFKDHALDAMMNYEFSITCGQYFIPGDNSISTEEFDKRLQHQRRLLGDEHCAVMQNLYGSHDTERIVSRVFNGQMDTSVENWFELTKTRRNPEYNYRKPSEEAIQIQKLMVLFQMTYLGAPMIYYGDEAGMWGANDPCCRKPMVWSEFDYVDESHDPSGKRRKGTDKVCFNHDLYQYYQKLIRIRREVATFQYGDCKTLLVDQDSYAFARSYKGSKVVVVLNRSTKAQKVSLPVKGAFVDVFNHLKPYNTQKRGLDLTLAPYEGSILLQI
jgi:glycosidase